MPTPRPRDLRRSAALALVAAIVLTIALTALAGNPAPETLTLVVISVVLDLVAIVAILTARRSWVRVIVVAYVFLQVLITATTFFLPGFLAYGAAAILLVWAPRRSTRRRSAASPHAFEAVADSWFGGSLTAPSLSRNVVGATQFGQQACVVCGKPADDAIHAPVDDAS